MFLPVYSLHDGTLKCTNPEDLLTAIFMGLAFFFMCILLLLYGILVSAIQGGNVPPLKGKNSRKRSLSENWLEHKPTTTVNSGDLLQPVYKKKKTVTNPQPKDLQDQQMNKYCLQHQEEDSQGAVKTSLYKVSSLV